LIELTVESNPVEKKDGFFIVLRSQFPNLKYCNLRKIIKNANDEWSLSTSKLCNPGSSTDGIKRLNDSISKNSLKSKTYRFIWKRY
jgi:hypothetical protein